MSDPAVSVIVPCYNGGRFLDDLCDSLAAQTFRDFETIIVNDGSTEEATLRKLASLEPAFRVVPQQNRRLPGARNAGFECARGEFVLPLDCDDRLAPSFLAETVAVLRASPRDVGFAFAHVRLVGDMNGIMPRHFNRFDQLFLNRLPYCMLIRRSAWQAAGGYDEAMADGMEDWEFNIRLLQAGFGGLEIAKPLLIYRVSGEGMLMSRTARRHGTIWRYIRTKHRDLYRVPALIAAWRANRAAPGEIAPLTAIGLLGLAKLLPEAWFNFLFYRLLTMTRARRVDHGKYQSTS
ncbi:MAG: glycosyltransferase family 2 protein [Hyphomicrobiales bacterium]|nr:glycosyltransferase family 2 protein [Hyphomicrobiales bacterium]MBV8826279.1 glycosyltransferase family 2 protein [Hyphomicrobiales bacterium]MBV9429718.1 glycosyltransferase family 2 protein [Bradyrhizobiaceae bacterium]